MASVNAPKSARLDFRISSEQRFLLERAAAVKSQTVTEFVLESASEAAQNALLDQRLFFADEADFVEFERLLDAPARVSEELRDLLSRSAPWE